MRYLMLLALLVINVFIATELFKNGAVSSTDSYFFLAHIRENSLWMTIDTSVATKITVHIIIFYDKRHNSINILQLNQHDQVIDISQS